MLSEVFNCLKLVFTNFQCSCLAVATLNHLQSHHTGCCLFLNFDIYCAEIHDVFSPATQLTHIHPLGLNTGRDHFM